MIKFFLGILISVNICQAQTYIKGPALIEVPTLTASAGGTTTLTNTSQTNEFITGTLAQTLVMPNATTLPIGRRFYITNRSTGTATVNANGGGLLASLPSTYQAEIILTTNGTAAGTWDVMIVSPAVSLTAVGASGNANAASIAGQVLTLQPASASFPGVLLSADWTTFNSKQAAGNYITALTTDVVATGPGSVAATIQANVVSNSKLAQMPTLTLKGNNTGGTANASDLTVTQTNAMLGTLSATRIIAPSFQNLISGTAATYALDYAFFVTSANATVGAVYTNNGVSYTVNSTIASGLVLYAHGTGAPTASGTLTKSSGVGDATITFAQFITPIYIRVRAVGGGGGGGGAGVANTSNAGNGTNTTFSTMTAGLGSGGIWGGVGGAGGAGGTGTVGAGNLGFCIPGGQGHGAQTTQTSLTELAGGAGAASAFGGAGAGGGWGPTGGGAAMTNSGSGGGGAGVGSSASQDYTGSGGGAGAFCDVIIPSPASSYTYTIGAGGAAGISSAANGGVGGTGDALVEAFYQ